MRRPPLAWGLPALLCCLLGGLLLLPAIAAAQQAPPTPQPIAPADRPQLAPGAAFLASALLPGAAQYVTRDERWLPYIVTEGWALVSYVQQRRRAEQFQQRYRDIAWQVARRVSAPPRRDSIFEYYAAMNHYSSSGTFDVDKLTPGVQPETQAGTFNGDLWQLSRELFGDRDFAAGTPGYQAALEYYLRHAIPDGYLWAWGGSNLEQQLFADVIVQSDAASRAAARYLGVLLANHIVSAVDALVTARLRELGGGALRIESGPIRHGEGIRWEHGVRIRF